MAASFVIVVFIVSGALIYVQAPAFAWLAWSLIWVAAGWFAGMTGPVVTTLLALVFVLPALVLKACPISMRGRRRASHAV
jgi:acyl-CoA dehydrogenase